MLDLNIFGRWLSLTSYVQGTKHFHDGVSPGAQPPGSGSVLSGLCVHTSSSIAAAVALQCGVETQLEKV